MNDPHRELVEKGYDRVAEQYLATKDPRDPLIFSALEEMARDILVLGLRLDIDPRERGSA